MTTQLFVVTLNNNNNGSSLQRKHLQTPQQNDKLKRGNFHSIARISLAISEKIVIKIHQNFCQKTTRMGVSHIGRALSIATLL